MLVIGECLFSYRINSQSLTHGHAEFIERMEAKVRYRALLRRRLLRDTISETEFMRWFRARGNALRRSLVSHFANSVVDLRLAGMGSDAFLKAIRCVQLRSWCWIYYKPLVHAAVPLWTIKYYRGLKQEKPGQQLPF
jgi:hypothetical protein